MDRWKLPNPELQQNLNLADYVREALVTTGPFGLLGLFGRLGFIFILEEIKWVKRKWIKGHYRGESWTLAAFELFDNRRPSGHRESWSNRWPIELINERLVQKCRTDRKTGASELDQRVHLYSINCVESIENGLSIERPAQLFDRERRVLGHCVLSLWSAATVWKSRSKSFSWFYF